MQGKRNFRAGTSDKLVLVGHHFTVGSAADLGPDIDVTVTTVTPTKLTLTLKIAAESATGSRAVTVTNPDLSVARLDDAINVRGA